MGSYKTRIYLLEWTPRFFFCNAVIFWIIGFNYLSWVSPVHFTVFSSTFFYPLVVWIYLIITWLSHFAFLAFIPALLSAFFTFIYPNRHFILILASLLATMAIALLITDYIVFDKFHYHLNGFFLHMFFAGASDQFFNFSTLELKIAFCSLVFIFCMELLLAYGTWFLYQRGFFLFNSFKRILSYLNVGLLFSYLMLLLSVSSSGYAFISQHSQAFPLYNKILTTILPSQYALRMIENAGTSHLFQLEPPTAPLHYPLHPLTFDKNSKPLNILFIVIDSWRFDTLEPSITPHIFNFSKNAWRFENHSSGGNCTQPGIFSLFYGLPNTYWSSMLAGHQGPLWIKELVKKNYQMGIFSSAALFLPPFDRTVFADVDHLHIKTFGKDPLLRDQQITREFKTFLNNKNFKDKPFFGFLFYDGAHSYCDIPVTNRPFSPIVSECLRLSLRNSEETLYFNRYKNALFGVDQEIGKIFNLLKSKNLMENTVILLTGDHGQEFNDNGAGYWEHSSNFTRYQVQTPLIIYWPGEKPHTFKHSTSHYDIAPSLMTYVLGSKNPPTDYSIGKLLLSPRPIPYLLVNSYTDYGIVEKNRVTRIYSTGNFQIEDNHSHVIQEAKPQTKLLIEAFHDLNKFYK